MRLDVAHMLLMCCVLESVTLIFTGQKIRCEAKAGLSQILCDLPSSLDRSATLCLRKMEEVRQKWRNACDLLCSHAKHSLFAGMILVSSGEAGRRAVGL